MNPAIPKTGLGAAGNQAESGVRDLRRNIEINVGKSCNNKCVFCLDGMPTREDKRFITFEAMRAELERYRSLGHLSVGFLGGEPTTYPKIAESIAYARELGYTRIALATNAMMLRRERFLDKLLDAGLTRVTVSMHGHKADLEDRQTLVPGGFEKKCTALRNMLDRKAQGALADGVSVNIVLNGWNYRALGPMMRFFFDRIGLDDLRANFVRPEGYAEGNPDLTPTLTDAVPYLMKAVLLNEYHFKKTFTFGGVPLCVLPQEFLRSPKLMERYVGDVFRDLATDCSVRSDGGDGGIAEEQGGRSRFNWQDRKRYDMKSRPEACHSCSLDAICEGLWGGYRDLYGEAELAPLRWEGSVAVRELAPPRAAPIARRVERVAKRALPVIMG